MSSSITFGSIVRDFFKENKRLALTYIIILILSPIQDVGVPHVIGKIIKSIKSKEFSVKLIYILMGLLACGQLATSLNDIIESRMYPRFQTFMSEKVLNYVIEYSKLNIQDILTGRIISILANIPKAMYNFIDTWRSLFIPQFIVALVAIIYIARRHWLLGLILVAIMCLYYLLMFITMNGCGRIIMQRESFLLSVNDEIDDILTSIVALFNHDTVENEKGRVRSYFKAYERLSKTALSCILKHKYTIVPLIIVLAMVFIFTGYKLVDQGKLEMEHFISILLIFMYVFGAIMRTVNIVKETSIRWGMIDEHMKVFKSLEEAKQVPIETCLRPELNNNKNTYISFNNVTVKSHGKPILQDLTFDVKKGEKLLIIGKIGKGKTTILKLLMRYQQPSDGCIYFNGIPIQGIQVEKLRTRIGFIPQSPVLLNRTVYENIVYGSTHVTKQQVLELLNMLKLNNIFDADKLDMKVGKHGSRLSGGQRQVVWILRVMLQNPEIILMDEPTSAIDNETKSFINDLFERVMKDRTVIVVSHDMSMAALCDRVLSLT
jgi:ABC-type multidrug transport system fused ATPase/permease subunit